MKERQPELKWYHEATLAILARSGFTYEISQWIPGPMELCRWTLKATSEGEPIEIGTGHTEAEMWERAFDTAAAHVGIQWKSMVEPVALQALKDKRYRDCDRRRPNASRYPKLSERRETPNGGRRWVGTPRRNPSSYPDRRDVNHPRIFDGRDPDRRKHGPPDRRCFVRVTK